MASVLKRGGQQSGIRPHCDAVHSQSHLCKSLRDNLLFFSNLKFLTGKQNVRIFEDQVTPREVRMLGSRKAVQICSRWALQ